MHFSEPLDVNGSTRFRVDANLLRTPGWPPVRATIHVQGTDDQGERKSWADIAAPISLTSGQIAATRFHDRRSKVRLVFETDRPVGPEQIQIRLIRED